MNLPDASMFLNMLKNKESVMSSILRDLEVSKKNMEGFAKLEECYSDGVAVSTDKVLKSAAKSLRHLNDVNMRILMLLVVYIGGDNYDSDAARVAMKMGAGDEAMKEFLNLKFGRKGA